MCFVNNDEYLIITSSNQYSSHYYGCDNRILSKIILNVILIPFWGIGCKCEYSLITTTFVIILQVAVLKYYRFNRISLFIVKLILGMIIMSIVVQTVMLALPSKK